jgi:hypothetical protein
MSPGVSAGTRWLVSLVLLAGGLVWVLDFTYRKRRYAITLPLIFGVAALAVAGFRYWPVSLVPGAVLVEEIALPAGSAGASNAQRVTFIPRGPAQAHNSHMTYVDQPPRPVRVEDIAVSTELSVAAPDRYVEVTSVDTRLTTGDGTVRTFTGIHQNYFDPRGRFAAIRLTLGLPDRSRPSPSLYPVLDLLEVTDGENPAPPGHPAHLAATMHLSEHRYQIEVALPLRAGATLRRPGELWRVDYVGRRDKHAVRVILRHICPTSVLHPIGLAAPGKLQSAANREAVGLALRNRVRNELTVSLGISERAVGGASSLESSIYECDFDRRETADGGTLIKGIDQAWIDDAEILLLTSHLTGEWTQEYAIDGFYLDRPTPVHPFWK